MDDLKRLKWRCRRGTLELDLMLQRYLEQCYELATPAEQSVFTQLLALEDSELLQYLMGNRRPESAPLAKIVDQIRGL